MAFADDLSNDDLDTNFPDGTAFGIWTSVFTGYGSTTVTEVDGSRAIRICPQASTTAEETHSGLVVGPHYDLDCAFTCGVRTQTHLRTGSVPNPWEVGWVIWRYSDPAHFYYFICKPNGWELGKRTPKGSGGQQFLQTGADTTFPVGQRYAVAVTQHGKRMDVSVDGNAIVSFVDENEPYLAGRVGLYVEDAEVFFDGLAGHGD